MKYGDICKYLTLGLSSARVYGWLMLIGIGIAYYVMAARVWGWPP